MRGISTIGYNLEVARLAQRSNDKLSPSASGHHGPKPTHTSFSRGNLDPTSEQQMNDRYLHWTVLARTIANARSRETAPQQRSTSTGG